MLKYKGLKDEIAVNAEKNPDRFTLKNMWDQFKKNYPNLKKSTFLRYCDEIISNLSNEEDMNDVIEKISTPKKSNNFVRVLFTGDWHCGHETGLVPPSWQYNLNNKKRKIKAKIQREIWNYFYNSIKEINKEKQIDVIIGNGDMIDGRGYRSGSTELVTVDRLQQADMAIECLNIINADKIYLTYGTPYHTGDAEDFEDYIAEAFDNAEISDELYVEINGKVIDAKHKVGNTSVPYSKATQISKQLLMSDLRAIKLDTRRVDILTRAHVHKYVEYRDAEHIAFTTPALQVGSKFGKRQCDGMIDVGMIVVDIYDDGRVDVKPLLADIQTKEIELKKYIPSK